MLWNGNNKTPKLWWLLELTKIIFILPLKKHFDKLINHSLLPWITPLKLIAKEKILPVTSKPRRIAYC